MADSQSSAEIGSATDPAARRYTRVDWVRAARQALIDDGIAAVKIDRLARKLEVTRGSFYWHFTGHPDLLDALLEDWEASNTESLIETVRAAGGDGEAQFRALLSAWIEENDFSPAYDAAMRDWARSSENVAARVRHADRRRIEMIADIFGTLGFGKGESDVRARITYYHQVGYYALAINETRAQRTKAFSLYTRVLVGRDLKP